jgi:hypothetical protein
MTMKGIKLAVIAAIILMMITPSLGAITKAEAEEVALPYVRTDETLKIIGPYTYKNHSYYYAEITIINSLSGVLIIDGETGKVVTDKEIAKKVSYTRAYFENVTPIDLEAFNRSKTVYTEVAANERKMAELYEDEMTRHNATDRKKLETIVNSYREAADVYDILANNMGQISATQTDIISGNASYENSMILTDQKKGWEDNLQKLGKALDKLRAGTNAYYGGSTKNDSLDAAMKESKETFVTKPTADIEEENTNTKNRVELDMKLMAARLNMTSGAETSGIEKSGAEKSGDEKPGAETPGFGLLFAFCSILIVGVLIKRRK